MCIVHYIYIPGLGDAFDPLRRLVLKRWRGRDVRVTFVPMRWRDKTETYEQKYKRVAETIEEISDSKIVLVGESAGASTALVVFSRHMERVDEVVTICGFNTGAADIHPLRRRHNPAFYPMSLRAEEVMRGMTMAVRRRIITIYSLLDRTVEPKYTQIKDAKQIVLRIPGHFLTISYVLIRSVKAMHEAYTKYRT